MLVVGGACFWLVWRVWGLEWACLARLEGARYEQKTRGKAAGTALLSLARFSLARNYRNQAGIPQGNEVCGGAGENLIEERAGAVKLGKSLQARVQQQRSVTEWFVARQDYIVLFFHAIESVWISS